MTPPTASALTDTPADSPAGSPADSATATASGASPEVAADPGTSTIADLADELSDAPSLTSAGAGITLRRPSRLLGMLASIGYGVIGFGLLGLLWQFAHTRADTLPGPIETLVTLKELLVDAFEPDGPAGQGIGLQLRDSLSRVMRGFAMAAAFGIPLGFLIGTNRVLFRIVNPVMQLLRPVSPLAWFPIWLTIMVKADPASVWVIFVTALWPTVINTAAGAASVPEFQRDVARVFRFSRWTEMRHIVIPHALPSVITGLRLSMGVAWMVIVAAEMLSAASGIGFFVWQSYNGPGLKYVISAIIVIGAVGVALDAMFMAIGKRIAPSEARS